MLNYGYGVLISQVRKQVAAAGLTPRYVSHTAIQEIQFRLYTTSWSRRDPCRLNLQMVRTIVSMIDIQSTNVVNELRGLLRP
jgi:hypothetical protein